MARRPPGCKCGNGAADHGRRGRNERIDSVMSSQYGLRQQVFKQSRRARPDRCGRERAMNTFDKRKEGFERKFAHDAELRFKAKARRNKLLGLWAAQLMGLSGTEAEEYARTLVRADLDEPGDDDVFRKLRRDFDASGVDRSDHQVRRTMDELMAEAIGQIETET
jgi:hypothetical protein